MPFSQDQFFNIFFYYNLSVFPARVFLNIIAIFSVFILFRKYSFSSKIINSILAFLWLWMGIIYHILFFSEINPAAYLYGTLFITQGILFIVFGIFTNKLTYSVSNPFLSVSGIIFILFALFVYPFLGLLFNHTYPYNPTFGLPCPTTIFTFGLLLFSENKIPFYLVIIPLFWSVVGFTAALNLGVYEDTGLLLSGVIGGALIFFNINKRNNTPF